MDTIRRLAPVLLRLTKSAAIDSGKLQLAFEEICQASAEALELARVSVWAYDPEAGSIRCVELYEHPSGKHSCGLELSELDFPRYFAAMKEERTLVMEDAHTDPVTSEFSAAYLTPLGISSMLDAPIRFDGRLWGVLCHEHIGPKRSWSLGEQSFAASLADYVARALAAQRRAGAQRQLEDLNSHLETLVELRTAELRKANQAASEALDKLQATQAELLEREKLAALGSVVAGIAHEINTPLGIAVTASTLGGEQLRALEEKFEAGTMKRSDLLAYLQTAKEVDQLLATNLARSAALVRSFKQVAVRQASDRVETFGLVDALESAVLSLSPEIRKSKVRVSVEGDRSLTLTAAPSFVFPLVSNLVMNAIVHAFPEGAEGKVAFEVRSTAAGGVSLTYKDDGQGVDTPTLARLFEPFFTTRRGRGGSGLGLSIVWNLVTVELGGTLRASSSPGAGLSMHIELPRLSPSAANKSAAEVLA